MEPLAFFPDKLRQKPKGLYECYSHSGQHSLCALEYAQELRLVDHTNPRIFSLVKELEGEGYKLDIITDWDGMIHVEYHPSNLIFEVRTYFTEERHGKLNCEVSRPFNSQREAEAYLLGLADLDGHNKYEVITSYE